MASTLNTAKKRPTKKQIEDSLRWLSMAQSELLHNEFFRVRLLCKQVIRALDRSAPIRDQASGNSCATASNSTKENQ